MEHVKQHPQRYRVERYRNGKGWVVSVIRPGQVPMLYSWQRTWAKAMDDANGRAARQ